MMELLQISPPMVAVKDNCPHEFYNHINWLDKNANIFCKHCDLLITMTNKDLMELYRMDYDKFQKLEELWEKIKGKINANQIQSGLEDKT
jgi:hypothetical protein